MAQVDPGAGHLGDDRRAVGPPPRNLVAILLDAYWTSLEDDPLPALLFTALVSVAGVLLLLFGDIVIFLLGRLVVILR